MTTLLILIYVAFISLGIPDSLTGSAWPAMHADFGVPIAWAGILSMIVSTGTVLSGLFSAKLIARFGTAKVTACSVLMTGLALLGMSLNRSFYLMALLCVPLGLGGGAVDAALNNFVAMHYEAKHMSWLHCFWGIGATIGPMMIGMLLTYTGQWQSGYGAMAAVQCVLALVMFLSLPLWRKVAEKSAMPESEIVALKPSAVLRIPLAVPTLLVFFAYCGAESTMGLWGASFLVSAKGISKDVAATWVSMFFFGITLGRFFSGFIVQRLHSNQMIRLGILCSGIGALLILLPLPVWVLPIGFAVVGFGFAPIFPSMLHQTPKTFGGKASQSVMGIQMAFAYIGATLMPPLFGALSSVLGMWLMPLYVLLFVGVMLGCSEYVNRRVGTQLDA
ncbi:MAG: MFS transporter [Clostridia bacterium]